MHKLSLSVLGLAAIAAPLAIATSASGVVPTLGSCSTSTSGSTITLMADCATSTTINVGDGMTVDGNGFSITAVDPSGGNFSGPVLKSATGTPTTPATMNVKNLDVVGVFASNLGTTSLSGLYYENAGGTITNVAISGFTTNNFAGAGRALEVRNGAATTAPTLSIDGLRVRNYNKSGVFIQGKTNYTATNLDIGPATSVDGSQWVLGASNSFTVFGGANGGPSGTLTNSKIAGNRYTTDDTDPNAPQSIAAGILAIDSPSLKVSGLTVTGVDSDTALMASNSDTTTPANVSITCSNLGRTAGGHADTKYGQAVINDPEGGVLNLTSGSNTYSGWAANTDGTITSTVDPACTPSVNAKVTVAANKDRVRKGHKIKVTGTAAPAKAGVMLSLQEKSGGAWSTVSSNTLTASGAFKFVEKAKGGHHPVKRFRVVIGTGTSYAGGTSNVVKVLVIR